ncbi:MAG: flavin oxidoreductase/NADH oxidase [Clostridia bacterium]
MEKVIEKICVETPIKVGNVDLPNRIVLQPMEGCDGEFDGAIGELTARRYMRFAESGAAIIWLEAVAVCKEGRANPRQLFLNDGTKSSFEKLIKDIKARAQEKFGVAPLVVMQMTHSGRYSKPNGSPEPLVAYRNAVWESGKETLPYKIVSDEYCDNIVVNYAKSAKLATEVGFDAVDVKCCHGYLFDEFLSAFDRDGKYGGSLENRTRLYFDCVSAVQNNIGEKMFVTTRLNACDCFDFHCGYGVNEKNEIDLTETKWIISHLREKGVRLVNLSIGNPYVIPHINRPCLNAPESGEVGLARIWKVTQEIQQAFGDMTIIASGLTFPQEKCMEYANEMLDHGVAKMVGFGRMSFAYPQFFQDYIRDGKLDKNKCCLRCSKCTELMRNGSVTGCPIRDKEIYMPLYQKFVLKKESL